MLIVLRRGASNADASVLPHLLQDVSLLVASVRVVIVVALHLLQFVVERLLYVPQRHEFEEFRMLRVVQGTQRLLHRYYAYSWHTSFLSIRPSMLSLFLIRELHKLCVFIQCGVHDKQRIPDTESCSATEKNRKTLRKVLDLISTTPEEPYKDIYLIFSRVKTTGSPLTMTEAENPTDFFRN